MTQAIVVTPGEPAGIGPDLCLLNADHLHHAVVAADADVIAARAKALKLNVSLHPYTRNNPHKDGALSILHIPCDAKVSAGHSVPDNGRYVLRTLDAAIDGTLSGEFSAITTGPINKAVINDAGVLFSGHTEYLAERTGAPLPVMLLATPGLRVALVTTHLPLREVADAITGPLVEQVTTIVDDALRRHFGLSKPHIYICGLNPHAGEGGHLGMEEIEIINPAIANLQQRGIDCSGSYPADTLFTPAKLEGCDAVVSMFHDQGLPVLKAKGFSAAVNITLGLPIVRTSVDHGSAEPLAGTGNIQTGSFRLALQAAEQLAAGRCTVV